jgi:hypothetical protein
MRAVKHRAPIRIRTQGRTYVSALREWPRLRTKSLRRFSEDGELRVFEFFFAPPVAVFLHRANVANFAFLILPLPATPNQTHPLLPQLILPLDLLDIAALLYQQTVFVSTPGGCGGI